MAVAPAVVPAPAVVTDLPKRPPSQLIEAASRERVLGTKFVRRAPVPFKR